MKLIRILVIAFLLSAGTSALAAHSFDFFVTPQFGTAYGYNKYIYDGYGYLDNAMNYYGHAKSELDFPIDAAYAGLEFGLRSKPTARREWMVEAGISLNLADARKKMLDHDWVDTAGAGGGKFSYTESKSDLHNVTAFVEGRFSFTRTQTIQLGAAFGLRYQHAQQNLIDAIGWQISYFSTPSDLVIYGLVGKYKVKWTTPYFGLYYQVTPSQRFSCHLMSAWAPTWASDRDDHLLRHFYTDGSGTGSGFIARAKAEYVLPVRSPGVHPFLSLGGDYVSLRATGKESMIWYGDDPATPGNDYGQVIRMISHNYTSRQLVLSLRLGFLF